MIRAELLNPGKDSVQGVEALFRKAGVVRCAGREELVAVASVFRYKALQGKRLAIVTQAGGPGVMLADALSEGGLQIPVLGAQAQTDLKGMLKIEGVEGVLVQKMAEGMELFIGALVHFAALCHGDKRAGFESTDW